MTAASIVADPKDATAEWLTKVLAQNDHDARVHSFEYRQIGTGQMARCFRFSMAIDGDETAPRSLIGKFNSSDPATREQAAEGGAYVNELNFYRELAAILPIATPHCFYAELDETGRNFALLLEDMSPAVQGDQMQGCSIAVAETAVDTLAHLHAATWNGELLQRCAWLTTHAELQEMSRIGLEHCAPEFIRRLGSQLDSQVLRLVDTMASGFGKLIASLDQQPRALTHNDFRADNLLIDETLTPPSVTVVDWQTLSRGAPLHDVAYFVGASLTADLRRKNEMDLLQRYYRQLCANGVVDFSWEDCLHGYKLGSFSGLTMAVNAFVQVEETDRGTEMFLTMARRHAQQIMDLGADTLLVA